MAKVKSVAKTKVKATKGKAKSNAKAKNDASPLAPLTNQSLSQETGAAVRFRYGPQEQAIKGQERASDQAQKNYTNWFGDYRKVVDQATQRSQQYSMDALNSIKGLADSSGKADAQNNDQMLQRFQQDAATRGASVDPSIAQISTQALASRRAGLDNHAAASLRVGTAQAQYMNDQRRIGSGREVNAHLTEQGRKRNLQQQFTQLKGQEGDYATTYKAGRVSDERKTQVAAAGLGLKAKDINAKLSIAAANNATKSSIAAGNNATTLAAAKLRLNQGKPLSSSQRLAIKRDRAQQKHHTGPYASPKGTKPNKQSATSIKFNTGITNITRRIHQIRGAYPGIQSPAITRILNREGYHGLAVDAARDIVFLGHLSSKNRSALRSIGVRIPKGW